MITFNTSPHLRMIGLILSLVFMISALPFALISSDQWQETVHAEVTASSGNPSEKTVPAPEKITAEKPQDKKSEPPEPKSGDDQPTLSVADSKPNPEMQMKSGDVSVNSAAYKWVPLVKWYCDKVLTEYGTSYRWTYLSQEVYLYHYFKEFKLYSAQYSVTFLYKGQDLVKNVVILFGSPAKAPNEFYLIDGCLSDTEVYPLKENWDKVKSSRLFGEYVGEYPTPTFSQGMKQLDIASLIGKGRSIEDVFPLSDTVVGVYSCLYRSIGEYRQRRYQEKIDFIDITKGKTICDSLLLEELGENESRSYAVNHMMEDNRIVLEISVFKQQTRDLENYTINTHPDGKIDSTREIKPWNKSQDEEIETSESGRYYTFRVNSDLYLHDNTMNTDTLIHKATISEIDLGYANDDDNCASGEFFIGDLLCYNEIAYERCNYIAVYNPETKETVYNYGEMHALFSAGGYVYGMKNDFGPGYIGRFRIDNSQELEKIIIDDIELPSIFLSNDNKYIIGNKLELSRYRFDSLGYDKNVITIYEEETFKVMKTYSLSSYTDYLAFVKIVGDDIFLQTSGSDNYAYVISRSDWE